jgi:hypothetical protein
MSRCLRFTASIQEDMSDVLVRLSACGGGSACLEASQTLVEWQARSGVSNPLRSFEQTKVSSTTTYIYVGTLYLNL